MCAKKQPSSFPLLKNVSVDASPRTIAQWREEAFMSQREFAEALGVSNSALSLWERGKRQPRHSTLREIAEKLGIKPQQIKPALTEQ